MCEGVRREGLISMIIMTIVIVINVVRIIVIMTIIMMTINADQMNADVRVWEERVAFATHFHAQVIIIIILTIIIMLVKIMMMMTMIKTLSSRPPLFFPLCPFICFSGSQRDFSGTNKGMNCHIDNNKKVWVVGALRLDVTNMSEITV